MKFYFLHKKSDDIGTTLKHKHPGTSKSDVKTLNKRIEKENIRPASSGLVQPVSIKLVIM